ncbi:hypothetical protein AS200_00560 [Streptomyces sp. CdTB01]|nr:hypothetical protein AS200_00560 [Streptomyces sp. CdTB01]
MLSVLQAKYVALDCSTDHAYRDAGQEADPDQPIVACATHRASGQPPTKYLLGPAILTGSEVASAKANYNTTTAAGWTVVLDFTSAGAKKFSDATGQLAQNQMPQNEFAVVVDGGVVSAPSVSQQLTGGTAEISGSFTEKEARDLAAELSSGALPVPLTFASATHITGP